MGKGVGLGKLLVVTVNNDFIFAACSSIQG